jgi:hypothetical protein
VKLVRGKGEEKARERESEKEERGGMNEGERERAS